jgi:hypothetical protein
VSDCVSEEAGKVELSLPAVIPLMARILTLEALFWYGFLLRQCKPL